MRSNESVATHELTRTTMSVPEAASYIGVHPDTIRTMVREKTIPHVRVRARILFRKDTLDAWMTQQEQQVLTATK